MCILVQSPEIQIHFASSTCYSDPDRDLDDSDSDSDLATQMDTIVNCTSVPHRELLPAAI